MKLAVINREKCKPTLCAHECKKYCPVEKKEADSCIVISGKAEINEDTCIGCKICVARCPFDAIDIVNLPSVSSKDIVHRYGVNGFALYGLAMPRPGEVLGFLGRNGIGKSTAVKLLSGQEKPNFGHDGESVKTKEYFKGTELQRYFNDLPKKKISYKPQNLSSLSVNVKVSDLLKKRGKESEILKMAKTLGVENVLENKLNLLSGGELQRVAILAACLGGSDIYFFDEPLAYLDIAERIRVSDFIKEINKEKTCVVVEHDLLILDYLTDTLNIFYGGQGSYGLVSGPKTSKEGINSYLAGFLKEENMRISDNEINFNFTKTSGLKGLKIGSWPDFKLKFDSGFELDVESGDIFQNHVTGILGRNGTGKTSFVRALAGETEVLIDGEKKRLGLDLKISYKPQYLQGNDETSVREICFKEKITKKLSNVFNLGVLQTKKLSELSGGELQRLSIARCLAKEADIYLIDEPSAYLDVEERINVARAIKDMMVEKERTAFVVDHDLLLVSYLADNIINFKGVGGIKGSASKITTFELGVGELLKSLDITLLKDKESGRPRINKKGSVLDRDQKEKEKWVILN